MTMEQIELLDETERYPHAEHLVSTLTALLEELGLGERELTVVLMDDESIALHNLADRGEAGPTDVLSYPTAEPDDDGFPQVPHLGDVLISVETAERQAEEHGHSLMDEVLVLAAHGLTHLRGFDHQTEADWQPFRDAQARVLVLGAAVGRG
jgi:probable rRNA maturation factor